MVIKYFKARSFANFSSSHSNHQQDILSNHRQNFYNTIPVVITEEKRECGTTYVSTSLQMKPHFWFRPPRLSSSQGSEVLTSPKKKTI